ncbi:acetyl-CoA C-acyltransferase [bacterium]|nr:acetyl-CoA C-acyltransferase [bacterium]
MQEVVIAAARRTAVGTFGGGLASVPAHELGAAVIKQVLADAGLTEMQIDEVIMGQILTAGCGQGPARQAAMAAGLTERTPAMSINRLCGSGLQAVIDAARLVALGEAELVVAGGQESMSRAPHLLPGSRDGRKMGGWELEDSMIRDGLWDVFNDYHMGITAENLAEKYGISREEQDVFAATSQQRAEKALKDGVFEGEIVPVEIPRRKGDPEVVSVDENPRPGVTAESLAKLRPAFKKDGTVTAGNASSINDGAAAVVVTSAEHAKVHGLPVLAVIRGWGVAGVDPAIMGIGPVPATDKALAMAGWTLEHIDLVEANEAFAAQSLAVTRELGWDLERVNVWGGAIALGHPIGASGARVLTTLLHGMQRRDDRRGLATLCVGGGMGVTMAVERV